MDVLRFWLQPALQEFYRISSSNVCYHGMHVPMHIAMQLIMREQFTEVRPSLHKSICHKQ